MKMLIAAGAGIGCLLAVALVLSVYRRSDIERVALDTAHDAVCLEREQIHRVLIMNATALRRAGRRQHAKVVDELLGLMKARPLNLSVKVRLGRIGKKAKDAAQG